MKFFNPKTAHENSAMLLFSCEVVESVTVNELILSSCYRLVAKLCLTFATPWTVANQVPLSIGFPRQEYWSGWPFPFLGDPPNPGRD